MASVNDTLDMLLDCVCTTLEDAGRPACGCGPVIGNPLWRPCCDCDGASGNLEAWLENMFPADPNVLIPIVRVETCRRSTWAADIAVQLTRCFPTVDENGQLPDQGEVAEAARGFGVDAVLVRRALTCCDTILRWRSLGTELDPEGGCSSLIARVTVGID